jgi:tetratricopeptide (TPR) repeat protein
MSLQTLIRFGSVVTAAGMLLQPAFTQTKGTTSTGGSTTGSGTTTGGSTVSRPTTTTPTPTTPSPTQGTQPPQTIFLSGRVMLEDGSAPTESVIIERVCSGSPHAEGYTDSKGYFSIRLGEQNNGVMHDASEEMGTPGMPGGNSTFNSVGNPSLTSGSRFSDNRYFDCDLRARLAGYRSQSVTLANRRPMDPPDVGVILLHRLGASEGTTVSAVALAAPKDARKAYEKGLEALKKHKPDDAVRDFQKTVEIYPKHAAAWIELGHYRLAQNDTVEARAYFQKAVEADPKFAGSYMELAVLDYKAESWPALLEVTDKIIQLDSFDYPQAHFLNALANYRLSNFDAAEKSAREALRLDTRKEYVATMHLLGVILAQKQDYPGAAEQLKAYLKEAPQASDAATVKGQLAQLERVLAAKGQDH